jgi:hypothetical protein
MRSTGEISLKWTMPSLTGFLKGWRPHRANALADPAWRAFASRCWRGLTLRRFLLRASKVGELKAKARGRAHRKFSHAGAPATRSNWQVCDGLRFCTTPRRRASFRYRNVVRLPFDSGCAEDVMCHKRPNTRFQGSARWSGIADISPPTHRSVAEASPVGSSRSPAGAHRESCRAGRGRR